MVSRASARHDLTVSVVAAPTLTDEHETSSVLTGEFGQATPAQRYIVIEELGRSPNAVLHRGYDTRLRREVVLKQMASGTESAQIHERLLREAQSMAQLSHPNVVAVYDVVEREEDVLLAMEYVPGTTLSQWLAVPGARRPWADIVEAFCAAGRGLAAAHAAGVLHRDFRSERILVGHDGRVRVSGFALSHATSEAADVTAGEQALQRWAPEQLQGGELTPAADQYALCAALWEALVGASAFEASPREALLRAKLQGAPAWPRDAPAPGYLGNILARGLAPSSDARWPSMDALLQALADDPRRRWRQIGVGAGALTLLLAWSGAAWSAWQAERAERCSGAETQLELTWNESRRDAAKKAFEASGVVYASDAWNAAAGRLDAYATEWKQQHEDACEATAIRGEQPVAVMDLRMGCLHRAKIGLQAATDALVRADADVVKRARDLLDGLPALERCSDVAALDADVPPPARADAPAVEAVRVALAEVEVLNQTGKYPQAEAAAASLTGRADEIGYGPLQTEVWLTVGNTFANVGAFARGEVVLRSAFRSALRWKQREQALRAAIDLVAIVGDMQHRPTEAFAFAAVARGLILPGDAVFRGILENSLGTVYTQMSRLPEAAAAYRSALEAWGDDHEAKSAIALGNLAMTLSDQGHYVEAEREQKKALALHLKFLGPDHPYVMATRINLSSALANQQKFDESRQELLTALAAGEKTLGPKHPWIGTCWNNLSAQTIHRGNYELAEEEARRALSIRLEVLGEEHQHTLETRHNLAKLLALRGRPEAAADAHREVLNLRTKVLGEEHPEVADSHHQLGVALTQAGRHAEAEPHYAAALATRRESYGDDHPKTVESRTALDAARQQLHER